MKISTKAPTFEQAVCALLRAKGVLGLPTRKRGDNTLWIMCGENKCVSWHEKCPEYLATGDAVGIEGQEVMDWCDAAGKRWLLTSWGALWQGECGQTGWTSITDLHVHADAVKELSDWASAYRQAKSM